jgi:hypothetical protein
MADVTGRTFCSCCGEDSGNVEVMLAVGVKFFICDQCVSQAVATIQQVRRSRDEQAELNRFAADAFHLWPLALFWDIAATEAQPS